MIIPPGFSFFLLFLAFLLALLHRIDDVGHLHDEVVEVGTLDRPPSMSAIDPPVAGLLELFILGLEVLDFLLELLGVILEHLAILFEALIAAVLLFCLCLEVFDLLNMLFLELFFFAEKSLDRCVDYFSGLG